MFKFAFLFALVAFVAADPSPSGIIAAPGIIAGPHLVAYPPIVTKTVVSGSLGHAPIIAAPWPLVKTVAGPAVIKTIW